MNNSESTSVETGIVPSSAPSCGLASIVVIDDEGIVRGTLEGKVTGAIRPRSVGNKFRSAVRRVRDTRDVAYYVVIVCGP